jgi:hypothetical protein
MKDFLINPEIYFLNDQKIYHVDDPDIREQNNREGHQKD